MLLRAHLVKWGRLVHLDQGFSWTQILHKTWSHVTEIQPNRRRTWSNRVPHPGLRRGRHHARRVWPSRGRQVHRIYFTWLFAKNTKSPFWRAYVLFWPQASLLNSWGQEICALWGRGGWSVLLGDSNVTLVGLNKKSDIVLLPWKVKFALSIWQKTLAHEQFHNGIPTECRCT